MISLRLSALKETRVFDYAVRFVLGGLVTCSAGLAADFSGPAIGGLFLAFPAIFLASATLIQSKERRQKRSHGMEGARRGQEAAALDAAGAACGSIGLLAFAIVVWLTTASLPIGAVLLLGMAVWLLVAAAAWRIGYFI